MIIQNNTQIIQQGPLHDKEGHLKKIAKESGIGVIGSLVGTTFSYFITLLGARYFGANDFGVFVLARTICDVAVMFSSAGMPKALDLYVPQFVAHGQLGKVRRLIRVLLLYSLTIGVTISVIVFLIANFFVKGKLGIVLKVMAITVPPTVAIEVLSYVFSGLKELRYEVIVKRIIIPIVFVALAVMVALEHLGLVAWAWALTVSIFAGLTSAVYFFQRKVWPWLKDVPVEGIATSKVVAYFLPLGVSGLILFFLAQINILSLGYYSAPKDVAIFSIYLSLLGFLSMIRTSVGRIYKPILAGMHLSESEPATMQHKSIYSQVSNWILQVNLLGVMLILLYGNDFLRLLVGSEYVINPLAFQILTISALIDYASGPCFETLEAMGNSRTILLFSFAMLLLSLMLNTLLIPKYGILGAAIAYFIVFTFANILGITAVRRKYNLIPFDRKYTKLLFLFMTLTLAMWWMKINFLIQIVWVNVPILGLLYLLGLTLLKVHDESDREILRIILNRVGINKIFVNSQKLL